MIPHRNIIKDIGRILFWLMIGLFGRALSMRTLYRVGTAMGDLDYVCFDHARTRKMLRNVCLALQYERKDARRVVRENLRNNYRNVLELAKYPQLIGAEMVAGVEPRGLEHLDAGLKKGKGVILMTAHFGAKQVLQAALASRGYRINQINYHKSESELSFIQKRVSQKQRLKIEEQIPVKFISASGFLRPVFQCLKANEVLIIAADGNGLKEHMDESHAPFEFLGQRMLFPAKLASLACRTGASAVPVFSIREGPRHAIVFEPPLTTEGRSEDEVVRQYVAVLEKYVRRYPELWEFWEEFEEGWLLLPKVP